MAARNQQTDPVGQRLHRGAVSQIGMLYGRMGQRSGSGISGKAAKSVGEKLKQIAKNHQVICITHQANIAAKGDYNYYISKKVEEGRTITSIKQLNEEETINEIARIASGECSKVALEHAKELRKIA